MARDPRYTKIRTPSKLADLVILAVFVGYSTQFFLAPETISTACAPGYTKIRTSSKLADLVISGRFHGQ